MSKKETKNQGQEEEKQDKSEPAEKHLEVTNPKTSQKEDGKDTTREVNTDEEPEVLEVKPEQVGSPSLEQFLQPDDTKAPEAGDPSKAAEEKVKSVLEQEKNS